MDATPLIGTRTGIGVFVAELQRGLAASPDLDLVEYTLSVGAKRRGEARGRWIPMPAEVARALWRTGHPRLERFTGPVDVVHGTNYVVPPSAAPRVVSVYDLSFVHDAATVPRSVAAFDRTVARAIAGGALVHTMSEFVADEIRARYGAPRVRVVPGGVKPRSMGAGRPRARPTVVVLGSTARRKRVPRIVEAFGMLSAEHDAELLIVGPPGDDEEAVGRAIERLGPAVAARITRTGHVDDGTRDRVLADASVLVFASDYEGFGFPVLEAMAAGTPVVTTTGGSLSEVAGDAAVLVPTGEAASLAAAVDRVLDDEGLRSQLAAAGRVRAGLFDWSRAVDGMIELYEEARD